MRERCYLAGIVALALLACGSDQNSAGQVVDVVGRVVEVQGMSADGGIHFLQPAAALSGPDGSVYVLDRGAKVVYRIHRGARAGGHALHGCVRTELRTGRGWA